MKQQFIISLKMLGIMALVSGFIYPLAVTGFARLFFPSEANGSLIEINGRLKGSGLIGQKTDTAIYFHTRPSATDYNTMASGGSNLGLTNKKLYDLTTIRRATVIRTNNLPPDAPIPSDMLFASASGLDPHISPQNAKIQIGRISESRGFSQEQEQRLNALVDSLTEKPQLGIFGCERINVLKINLELDKLK